jgi:hypothetical protein
MTESNWDLEPNIKEPHKIIMWLRTYVVVGKDNECWPVLGSYIEKQHGYSVVSQQINGKQKNTGGHRIMWELFNGPIPKGMVIDHVCHNIALAKGECLGGETCQHRRCVNPSHLNLTTDRENVAAGAAGPLENMGLCKNKLHKWIPDNIAIEKGRRRCRMCNREAYYRRADKTNAERRQKRMDNK